MLSRRVKIRGEEFTNALDIWSLGCLVHEILTSQTPFLEPDFDLDELLKSDFTVQEPAISVDSLFAYCQRKIAFSTKLLQTSHADQEGIDFVRSLLVANPSDRATASTALQNPWLENIGYTSDWYRELKKRFLDLGLDLDLGSRFNGALLRQIHTFDIMRFLPASAADNPPVLL